MNQSFPKILSGKYSSPSLTRLADNNNCSFHKILWGRGKIISQEIPKIIWLYWTSITPSPLVEICISQIKKLHPKYEVYILNEKNIHLFLPQITKQRTDLPLANYTDLIRLKLLERYGGFWLDASILLAENLDWAYRLKQENNADIIGFYSDFFTSDWDFPLLETWFLGAAPNNRFISAWANEFEQCYTSENPHRYYDKEKKNSHFLQKIDAHLGDYLIAYLAASKIMRECQDFRLCMISANDIGHYYNFGLQLKPHQLQEIFLFSKEKHLKYLPLIKFEKKGRTAIDEALDRGHYHKKSHLFSIAPQKNYYLKKLPKLSKFFLYIIKNMIKNYAK